MTFKHITLITIKIGVFIMLIQSVAQAATLSKEVLSLPITTLSGEQIKLAQFIGNKPVYLKFWATWCKPCREQMPHFQQIQSSYGDKIKVIAINLGVNDDLQHVKATVKEFSLTMSTTVDSTGKLAQSVNLIGTPYHVLIDTKGNIIHKGFEASSKLDSTIQSLISEKAMTVATVDEPVKNNQDLNIITKNKTNALFFVSTWCEWYLKESRPSMSENCVTAQKTVNDLYKKFPALNWHGIVSRLWTGDKELNTYKEKFNVSHSLKIDVSNKTFFNYKVNTFPTLIIVKNGIELARINHFTNKKELEGKIRKLIK